MFVSFFPVSASAETNAGIGPSSFFYFFDITLEKIGLFFTFSSEKKVQKALVYAEERLAEVEAVANENNPEAVAEAMANYQKNVALAITESKEIKNENKAEELLNTVSENTARHQEVLESVLEKVPDEAKEAILKAIELSRKGQEEAMKQIAELRGEIEGLKKEVAELKQADNSEQTVEIEKLKKEIEELKKKPATTPVPVVSTPKLTPPPTTSDNNSLSPTSPTVENWSELESKYFAEANQKGWINFIITNSLGEKRYYRKEGGQWARKNNEAEIQQPYIPPASPPTANQLSRLRRFCLASPEIASVCADSNFMPWYYSNLTFRFLIDELVDKYHAYLSSQEQQKIAAEIKILDCLMAPTPEDQRVLDPATQNYLRQVRCGTVTDADKTNYELSRIKSSVDELKYRLETKTSFPPVFLDTVEPTGFGTRWEIRWDGFGGGTITDSTGGFYQFRCETNYCVSY